MGKDLEIKSISINKITKRFQKKYGEDFDTYYWNVKFIDKESNSKLKVKFAIGKTYRDLILIRKDWLDKNISLEKKGEIEDEIMYEFENYLIENQEAYLGEDGDLYLIGE